MGSIITCCYVDDVQQEHNQIKKDKQKKSQKDNQRNSQSFKKQKRQDPAPQAKIEREQIITKIISNLSPELQAINNKIENCQNPNQKIELVIEKANILEKQKDYQQILTILKELVSDPTYLDESTLGYIYFRIANTYALDSNHRQSQKNIKDYLDKAQSIYKNKSDIFQQEMVALKNSLGFYYENIKEWRNAEKEYQQAYQIGTKVYGQQDNRTIIILNNLACSYFQNNKKDQWHQAIQKCRKWSKGKDISKLIQENYTYYSEKQKEQYKQNQIKNS